MIPQPCLKYLLLIGLSISGLNLTDRVYGQDHLIIDSEIGKLLLESVSDTFVVPYGMAFLPDGKILVSDRPKGLIYLLDPHTRIKKPVQNLQGVKGLSFGGMLDIALHPKYAQNGWIYFNHTIKEAQGYALVLERAKLRGSALVSRQRLFTALPYHDSEGHFGSSIVLQNGYVFFSTGDFYDLKDSAQTLSNHLGKIIRLHEDGRIPRDNPFVNMPGAKPEIWSLGHRNPQGLALNPASNQLWEHEHGPKGGDEINIIQKGKNYGWPIITHGIDYDGKPIGLGIKEKEGLEQPIYFYDPSIAPCGMLFYSGQRFPEWKNNLFIGALALRHLNRLVIRGDKIVHEERLFTDHRWRIRNVKVGPDGFVYIAIDNGRIMRIKPY